MMLWADLSLFRPIFQLCDQFIPVVTVAYSFLLLASFFVCAGKGRIVFNRLSLLFLVYIVISFFISLANGASLGTLVSSFNKLLLFYAIFLTIQGFSLGFSSRRTHRLFQILTYGQAVYVLVSLLIPGSYALSWDVKTFVMVFESQHLTATFIISLIAAIYFDMGLTSKKTWVFEFFLASGLIYALFMTGARTFTICGLVMYGMLLCRFLSAFDTRSRIIISVLLIAAVLGTIYAQQDMLAFFQKNDTTASASFSNGRDEIWGFYLNVLKDSDFLSLLFGHGCGFYETDAAFWVGSHNDFLTFAVSYGLAGLVLYVLFVFQSIRWIANKKIAAVILVLFAFSAFSNGCFGYTDFVLALTMFSVGSCGTQDELRFANRIAKAGSSGCFGSRNY